ncbi:AgmX/PglI C-terminal domain-containing protein [Agaribacterium haliotis]|uniref:AgmX/PglI C-terminal domain-containing protein n=1 Tax=Agaribacterium haliotis TaxID=2013869 RepID=UPI000BB534BC|nr:AgmX/PglI C-terminal domain-containing protein [Agaribacterium haliotis]
MSTIPMPNSPYEPLALELELPWVADLEREQKLKRNIKRASAAVIVFVSVLQFLPVLTEPEQDESVVRTVLMLEPEPLPEQAEPEPEPAPVEAPKPVQKLATTSKAAPAEKKQQNQTVVQAQGLDTLSSQLASLSSAVDLQKLRRKNVSSSSNGTKAQSASSKLGADSVTRRSGGVVIDDKSMRSDAAQLASHQATEVDGLDLSSGLVSTSDAYGEIRSGVRDMESVRRALEAAKSRVYARYQRALNENPELAGKFRFQLVIEPSGQISSLSLLSSELGLNSLEREILGQIKQVSFGEEDVITTKVEYTFVFLPS